MGTYIPRATYKIKPFEKAFVSKSVTEARPKIEQGILFLEGYFFLSKLTASEEEVIVVVFSWSQSLFILARKTLFIPENTDQAFYKPCKILFTPYALPLNMSLKASFL